MSNSLFYLLVSALLYGISLLLPFFMKRSILFGVRIPLDSKAERFIRATIRQYRFLISALFLGYILISLVILNYYFNLTLFEILIFGDLVIYLSVIYYFNKKTLRWKNSILASQATQNTIVVDTAFREGKVTISPWWFLISFAVVGLHFIYVNFQYDRFPQRLAVHYNIQGQADRFIPKSWWAVNQLPLISLGIVLLMFGIFYVIRRSKQEIDPSNPDISVHQDRRFRYYWSVYVVIVSILMSAYFFYFSCLILFSYFSVWIIWSVPFLIIAFTIGLALYTGQSGWRLKEKSPLSSERIKAMRDDDRYWIGGLFYCNKNDPAIFVEKRIGIGWTINFCNIWGVLILAVTLLLILIALLL